MKIYQYGEETALYLHGVNGYENDPTQDLDQSLNDYLKL